MPIKPDISSVRKGAETVSIVVPVYNKERYVAACLENIQNQLDAIHEVIVIDDKSTDSSLAVVKKQAKNHPKIKIVENTENIGVVQCLRKGAAIATGSCIQFLGGEDMILPGFIEKSLELLARHKEAAFSCSEVYRIDADYHVRSLQPSFKPSSRAEYLSPDETAIRIKGGDNWFCNSSVIYRRCIFDHYGGFDANLESFCDGYLTRILSFKEGFCFIPLPLAAWRSEEDSYSKKCWSDMRYNSNLLGKIVNAFDRDLRGTGFEWYVELFKRRWIFDMARVNIGSPWILREIYVNYREDLPGLSIFKYFPDRLAPLLIVFLFVQLKPYGYAMIINAVIKSAAGRLYRLFRPQKV